MNKMQLFNNKTAAILFQ